jgi:asparagine synthase (glutamine-hydrolysing)
MCGIAGIFGNGASEHVEAVQKMIDSMSHRGPDGQGIYVSSGGTCVLGHRRLSILDLSEAAAQPMVSSDGNNVLVYNGECYNFKELRDELRNSGESFISSGDTEVLLRLFARDGISVLPKLNAMFALAFWDERKQELLLARDRYGQKPLYFARIGKLLLFASEVRALLASGIVPRKADLGAIQSYLAYGSVQEPFTIVSGVSLLGPGSYMTFGLQGKERTDFYWSYPVEKKEVSKDELRKSFISAVERHLISDAPLGLFLSGGIDSSAVVAATAACSVSERIKTLCVDFPDQPELSEAKYAAMIATRAQTDHHEVAITGSKMLQMLPKALSAMDQPTGDAINTYIVSYAASQVGLKVALSGLGGDELFAGYSTFTSVPKIFYMRRLLAFIRRPAANFLERCGQFSIKLSKLAEILDGPPDLLSSYLARRRVFSSRQLKTLMPELANGQWDSALNTQFFQELNAITTTHQIPDAIGLLEMRAYMGQTLLRDSDTMGMAHGLEIRQPFLDTEFSSSVLALESQTRVPRACPKWRLVEAMRDCLPNDIVNHPKQGFTLPFENWMLYELKDRVQEGITVLVKSCKLMRKDVLYGLWEQFCYQPQKIGWFRPWILFVLGHYLEQHKLEI